MFLATVIGQVVATKKEADLQGRRLLILRPLLVDEQEPGQLKNGQNTVVAIDSLGAGVGECVLFVQGSSARMASGLKTVPTDAAVIGIVDGVTVLGKQLYTTQESSR